VGEVRWLHFSADGRHLASFGADNIFYLWDASTGKELRRFEIPGLPQAANLPANVDFLPMRRMRHFYGVEIPALSFAISGDGKRLATIDAQSLQVWDLEHQKKLRRVEFKEFSPRILGISHDGQRIALWEMSLQTGEGLVRLMDVKGGKEIRQFKLPRHRQGPSQLVFSPDGSFLAGVENNDIRLWNLASGKRMRLFQGHEQQITSLIFKPDSKGLASAGPDAIRFWDLDSEEEAFKIETGQNPVSTMVFSQDGTILVTGSADKAVRLINSANGKEQRHFEGHLGSPMALALAADGKTLASGSSTGTIRLWNLITGKERKLPRRRDQLIPVTGLEGGTLLALEQATGVVCRLEPFSGKVLKRLPKPTSKFSNLAVSPDGKMMALEEMDPGKEGPAVRLWKIGDKKEQTLEGLSGWVTNVRFSHAGRLLATAGADQTITLWNVATGKNVHKMTSRGQWTGERAEMMWMMMMRGGGPMGPGMSQTRLAFSDDDRVLATSGFDNTITLWETASGKERCRFPAHQAPLTFLAFSPDGRLLATASADESIRLWKTRNGKLVRGLIGHKGEVRCLAFSANGKVLASGGDDGIVCLWEVASGKQLRRLTGHRGAVTRLAFAADGNSLFSGSKDATILVWDVLVPAAVVPPGPGPTKAKLEALWADLAGSDADAAHQAIATLADYSKDTVTFFQARLQPEAAMDKSRILKLIADLDHANFAVRQKATRALERLGGQGKAALEKAQAAPSSPETAKRLGAILKKLEAPASSPDVLRLLRAVEVLERLGTVEARQLLQAYAKGASGSPLTEDAREALKRLKKRGG
jgi:WD40 repeat protein